jgi:hypothetical protein
MVRRQQCFEPRKELRVPVIPDTCFDRCTSRRAQITSRSARTRFPLPEADRPSMAAGRDGTR